MEHHRGGGGAIPFRRPWLAGCVKARARINDREYRAVLGIILKAGKLGLSPVIRLAAMANPIKIIKGLIKVQEQVGDFIANGPDTGLPGHVRNQYRNRCDQFANLPGWAQLLGNGSAGTMNRICTPYWDAGGFDGPEVAPPPFNGGQCAGAAYTVTATVTATSPYTGGVLTTNISRSAIGPITEIRADALSTRSNCTLPGGGDGNFNVRDTVFRLLVTGNGVLNITQSAIIAGNWGPAGCTGDVVLPSDVTVITNLVVTRNGGLPDDCGNLPDTVRPGPNPPPDPGPTPGPEPTTDPDNPFGPPLLPIPPYIDPVFGPTDIGDPDPDGGGGGAGGGDGLPGDPDAIAEPAGSTGAGPDGADVDFGEPPEGRIWVAAIIEADVDSRLGNIPGTGPAQTVYPSVIGNASLIYDGARGSNNRITSDSTVITRETTALVLTGCRLQAQPGVTLTVSPISALTCPENPCEDTNG
jgi:hypothetical protein